MTTEGREIGFIETAIESAENIRDTVARPFVSAINGIKEFAIRGRRGLAFSVTLMVLGTSVAAGGVGIGLTYATKDAETVIVPDSTTPHYLQDKDYSPLMAALAAIGVGMFGLAGGVAGKENNRPHRKTLH